MNYLYLDETEDEKYFIIGGVLTTDIKKVEDAVYETKRNIKRKKGIPEKTKAKILTELKERDLNSWGLQDIKKHFFLNLTLDKVKFRGKNVFTPNPKVKVIGVIHIKENSSLVNEKKGYIYFKMLELLLSDPLFKEKEIEIIYDEFSSEYFDKSIETTIDSYINLKKIQSGNSEVVKALQAADLCVGSIRRNLNGEKNCYYYELIKDITYSIEYLEEHSQKQLKKEYIS